MQERGSLNRIVRFGVIGFGILVAVLCLYLSGILFWRTYTDSATVTCRPFEPVYVHLIGDGLKLEITNDCVPKAVWISGNDSVVVIYNEYSKTKGTVIKSDGTNNTIVFTCYWECDGWFKMFPVRIDNETHIVTQNDIIRLEHRFNEMENDTYNLKDVMHLRKKWW